MTLTINGEPRAIDGPCTVAEFLERRGLHVRMVVVERNGEIVPRDRYADTPLDHGDRLEIVQMMAGG